MRIEVVETFKFSPDGREVVTYEPGEHEVSELCAVYAGRKGFATYEGAPNLFEVDCGPLDQSSESAPAKGKKSKKKSS
ncbi:MAG: hypothetical protein AUJ49_05010 [Desulfovibrionaceae bacterium CG1_02_65_16]|nr:MAG: hypothetical protein AUJ49_05010 [Desulfovibrionaceae bacterium CG1_02_65_16]